MAEEKNARQRGTDGHPNRSTRGSSHDNTEPCRGTERRVNFRTRPPEPDFITMLRQMNPRDQVEWIRWLSDHAMVLIALWVLNTARTPAELEELYRGLRPLVKDDSEYGPILDGIYTEMWDHFTGGHS